VFSKTLAIVLNSFPYSDNSRIVHLYTKNRGRISVFVRHSGKRNASKMSLLQPFSVLEVTFSDNPSRTMQYVKEYSAAVVFRSIPFNPFKSAITLFIAEVLYKVLQEQQNDDAVFDFLTNSIIFFDECSKGVSNFHLIFLLQFSKFLGFAPNIENYGENAFFDLKNGSICYDSLLCQYFLSQEETKIFVQLLRFNFSTMHLLKLSRVHRQTILEQILLFYRLHLPEFNSIKSVDILKQIFD
jgi:DNA repair protein RecO (recombination protein O)